MVCGLKLCRFQPSRACMIFDGLITGKRQNTYLLFTMAHLFKQIYVKDIDFEAITTEKLIDLVFTEIHQLKEATLSKKDETDGNQ